MIRSARPLERLQRVDLREVWVDEARDFTPWLAEDANLRLLGETIGTELELEAVEHRVGVFKADIVAKVAGTDDRVIIENQLGKTNHDHLGKLLTYASGVSARSVIWIAAEIAEEHRRALDWLNEISGENLGFFGLEVELWRIGGSSPAPKFNLVCQPNEWAKSLSDAASGGEPSETKLAQLEFWKGFVEFAKSRGSGLGLRKPRPQHWYPLAVGRSGFTFSLTVSTTKKRLGCELFISHPQAKSAFDQLIEQKAAIESEVGELEWQRLPQKRACRIAAFRPGDIEDEATRLSLYEWFLERVTSFGRTFSERVRRLDLEGEAEEVE